MMTGFFDLDATRTGPGVVVVVVVDVDLVEPVADSHVFPNRHCLRTSPSQMTTSARIDTSHCLNTFLFPTQT